MSRTDERLAGFSLVEVLVTLLVVVLVMSLASLQLGSGSGARRLRAEVDYVASLVDFARIEAQSRGRDIGLAVSRPPERGGVLELRWLRREPAAREIEAAGAAASRSPSRPPGPPQGDRWVPAERDSAPLAPMLLGADVGAEAELWVGDIALDPAQGDPEAPPPVVFYAGGEATPAELRWRDREDGRLRWRLGWDLLGRLQLAEGDAALGSAVDAR